MKFQLLWIVLPVLIVCGCKKDKKPEEPSPGEFYISFKMNNNNISYKVGPDYTYMRGGSMSLYPNYYFKPSTNVTPLPLNLNVYTAGFVFNYLPDCPSCDPKWVEYGNKIFTTGARQICYTGVNWDAKPYDLGCLSNDGIVIFWTDQNGTLLNSAASAQPAGNYYTLDSVIDFHFESSRGSWNTFDKILVGKFKARLFDPQNKSYYKDLEAGTFRMPIWKNGTW